MIKIHYIFDFEIFSSPGIIAHHFCLDKIAYKSVEGIEDQANGRT